MTDRVPARGARLAENSAAVHEIVGPSSAIRNHAPTAEEGAHQAQQRQTEDHRLEETPELGIPWRKWGPYVSERQWGSVREDYSQSGNAWDYFSHDQARSRAYRWGEDGLAGVSDDQQQLCLALRCGTASIPS